MLRTGKAYIESLRDGREVWIDGERVGDVPTHPAFAPIVSLRARIYDLGHEAGTRDLLTYADEQSAERCATTSRPPRTRDDWRAKRASIDAILDDAGGVVTRVGDETIGEMWSLFDGQDVLNEMDPAFSANIASTSAGHSYSTRSTSRPTLTPRVTVPPAARPGSGHIAARGRRNRKRHRGARGKVRDRGGLRQPGIRQADDR